MEDNFPQPKPKAGQVLIKVSHAGLNPVDYKLTGSWMIYEMKKSNGAVVLGEDIAGKVVAAPDCKKIKVDDEVVAYTGLLGGGAFAEYVVVSEDLVVKRPRALSAAQAASFPLVALTGRTALETLGVQTKHKLLILGGTSATGAYTTQIAKRLLGVVRVAVTCGGGESAARCKAFGADDTIDYKTQNWWEVLKGQQFDAVLDTVGGAEQWEHAKEVLKPGGRFGTIVGGASNGAIDGLILTQRAFVSLGRQLKSWFNSNEPTYTFISLKEDGKLLTELAEAFDHPDPAHRLEPYVDRVFPWTQWKDAIALQNSQRAKGKIVVEISN